MQEERQSANVGSKLQQAAQLLSLATSAVGARRVSLFRTF